MNAAAMTMPSQKLHAVADQDHEPGASAVADGRCVAVQCVVVLGFIALVRVGVVTMRVAPQHELFEQEERQQADEHRQHHLRRLTRFQRMRQS
jgi:hypothetical protein